MRRLALASAVLAVLLGCDDAAAPEREALTPHRTIVDGAHNNGNAHFFFLPPMVPAPSPVGTADGALSPTVVVCEWSGSACGPTVAEFSPTAGTGSEVVRYDATAEHYIVNWHTDRCLAGACTLDPDKTYRVVVRVGAVELGHADVDVVNNGSQLRNVLTEEFIGLVNGRTLPVKFRIEHGALLPVLPVVFTIDARPLSIATLDFDGVGSFPTTAVQSYTLGAGSYKLYHNTWVSQPSVIFTVTSAGTIDYSVTLDGVLSGRGTRSLRVNGRTIQLDARALSVGSLEMPGDVAPFPTSAVQTVTLLPAEHIVVHSTWVSQPSVRFILTNAGTVDYAVTLDGVVDGRGTTALLINGRTMSLDARPLSVGLLEMPGVFGGPTSLATSGIQSMTLLPAEYSIVYSTGVSHGSAVFTLDNAGAVDYAPTLDDILAGRSTSTLRINGRTIQVDATAVSASATTVFTVNGVGNFPTSTVQSMTLLPAQHQMVIGTRTFDFELLSNGTVSYDPALLFLTGAGTGTLVIIP